MFSLKEILEATNGRLIMGSGASRISGVSTDSRTIQKGELFIALKGTKYDGHAFVGSSLKRGAAGSIVDSKYTSSSLVKKLSKYSDRFVISVAETLSALGSIARFYRRRFDIPVVAVTGSNGKTTAKEMIWSVLKNKWSVLKNYGTENNLIGVPLTLLKLNDKNESAIIELGMNRAGEIGRLAEIASPNMGVVTNIGPSHLEYLGSLSAVYRAKKELLDFLGKGDTAVLNSDDNFLRRFKRKGLKIFTFGISVKSDFRAADIRKKEIGWRFSVNGRDYSISLPAYHDIYNALAAITVGTLFNVTTAEIRDALGGYSHLEKRMTRNVINGVQFIDDTYNSNPLSLESAIETLVSFRTRGRRILVSGDMLELGCKAGYYHARIGRLVARSNINMFIGVGDLMHNTFMTAKRNGMKDAWFCSSKERAAELLETVVHPDDVVLVKGSRAMQMEKVIECFITSFTR